MKETWVGGLARKYRLQQTSNPFILLAQQAVKANTQRGSDQTQKKRRTWNEPPNQTNDKHLSFHNDLLTQDYMVLITSTRGVVLSATFFDFSIPLITLTGCRIFPSENFSYPTFSAKKKIGFYSSANYVCFFQKSIKPIF